jgi:hypothetical protein
VLLEVSSTLSALTSAGHFAYLDYQEKFNSENLEELNSRAVALETELGCWDAMVSEMRQKYYFLNFFSMSQIIQLLCDFQQGMPK